MNRVQHQAALKEYLDGLPDCPNDLQTSLMINNQVSWLYRNIFVALNFRIKIEYSNPILVWTNIQEILLVTLHSYTQLTVKWADLLHLKK